MVGRLSAESSLSRPNVGSAVPVPSLPAQVVVVWNTSVAIGESFAGPGSCRPSPATDAGDPQAVDC